ncbi:hypothetical protein, partial [Acinetobacter baumannii]|uniref:hypothetical protein n=1 Tax=Acinetobacter baumannii TaxID=470 RepID=UPI000E14AC5D
YNWNTWAAIGDAEPAVWIGYFVQDAEPDTNNSRGVELESITDRHGKDLMPSMTAEEIEQVVQRLIAEV